MRYGIYGSCVFSANLNISFHSESKSLGVIVWLLDLQLHEQSVSITTKVVSSNLVHGKVYSIQHYVIKFVSDLREVGGFLRILSFLHQIKLTTTI
jgi:hypothetical protein